MLGGHVDLSLPLWICQSLVLRPRWARSKLTTQTYGTLLHQHVDFIQSVQVKLLNTPLRF